MEDAPPLSRSLVAGQLHVKKVLHGPIRNTRWPRRAMAGWPPTLDDVPWVPDHWTYLAEGAANVLLRYVGPSQWPFVARDEKGTQLLALRLPKRQYKRPACQTVPVDEYIDKVISRVLPKESLPVLRRIPHDVNNEPSPGLRVFLCDVAQRCEPRRPESRRKAGEIDVNTKAIWATQDLCGSAADAPPRLVVEIKVRALTDPAQMWVPFRRPYGLPP